MLCRSCGTEIADKAIVCYRCGAATTDPVRKAVVIKPRRNPMPSFVAAAILVLAALYAAYVSGDTPDPTRWRAIAAVLAGAAGIVIVLSLVRRR